MSRRPSHNARPYTRFDDRHVLALHHQGLTVRLIHERVGGTIRGVRYALARGLARAAAQDMDADGRRAA